MKAEHSDHAEALGAESEAVHVDPAEDHGVRDTAIATVATVAVVAVGAVIFEAALIPGLALGVVAALAPQYAPKVGSALSPLFRSTVRGAYKFGRKSREMFAEAQEHFGDIAAEVSAEDATKAAEAHAEPAVAGAEPVSH